MKRKSSSDSATPSTAERPNILFIIDTSGSMSTNVTTQVPFNPSTVYPGTCSSGRVYFESGTDASDPPSCTNANSVPARRIQVPDRARPDGDIRLLCRDARRTVARRRARAGATSTAIPGPTAWVECQADAGSHGDGVNLTKLWAADAAQGPWTANSAQAITWTANNANRSYVFYSANYINWLDNASTITQSRIDIVKQVATNTIAQLAIDDQVNVGLMQFSNNTDGGCGTTGTSEGGMVLREIGPVAANAALLTADIAALNADGCTPLSESMYEAYLYLSGGRVDYGINSRKSPTVAHASVLSSRQPAPNTAHLQEPDHDLLPAELHRPPDGRIADRRQFGESRDPGALRRYRLRRVRATAAAWRKSRDTCTRTTSRPTLAGQQIVTTFTVGFGPEVAGSAALRNTAIGAGGDFYEANDTASLSTVFAALTRDILAFNTSFTAPAVSVNAFNRTQNLNDLYVTVFRPSETYFWDGNIKKYKITPLGVIEDVNDDPAVDVTTGFFRENSRSFWADGEDGDPITLGGAANELPDPGPRKVYSDINTASALTAAANRS